MCVITSHIDLLYTHTHDTKTKGTHQTHTPSFPHTFYTILCSNMENLQPLNNTMLVSSLIAFALIIDVSFATTPMDYGAAVNILGPTVDEMASSVRGRDPVAPLRTTSIAALAYEQSVILPLLQDCQATMKADRGGLGEFLKSQSKLDDRVFQERLSELVRLQHDAKLSESLESILKKDYEASEKAERDIANTMQNFKGLSNERAGVVQKTGDDVGNAAKTALNNGTKLTYRQRKYLRESSTLQSEAKVAGGSQDEVDDIKNLVKDGAKGTSRWVRETEKKSSRKFSVVARKHAEKLKKYISLRSVVSSGITETNAAKLEWDNTLDAICRPFLIDILSTRQVVASTRAMLRSFEEEEESNDEEDNEIILGHDLGRARLHCENCDEEEEEEEEEKVVEVVEEIEEIPEFPEPCYYCVKRGDSVFSIASKFKVEPLAIHLTSDWDFSTKAQQFVSSSKILFDSNEENRYLPVNTSLKVHLPPHVVEVASIEKFGDDSEEQDSKIFGYVAVTDVDRHTIRVAVQVEGFKNKIRVAVHSGKSCESHNHLDSHFYDLSKIPMINQSSSSNETALKRKPLVMRARIHPTYKKYFDMIIHDGKLPNEVYGIMDPSLDKSLIRTPNRLVPVELAPSSIGEDGDPWKIPEAKFEIDSEGKVHGIFDLSCGLSATQLENRAVAIEQVDKHGQWHMKACGTLRARKGGFSWNGFQDDGSYRHNEMCTSPEMMMHCKPEKIPVHGRQILDMLKPLKEYEACVEDSSFRENLGQKAFASVADAESISVEGWVYMSQSGGELARISAERRERLEQSDEGLHAEETVEQRARRLDREAVVGALVAGTLHSSDVNPATGVRDGSGPYQRGWALSVEATPKPVKQASMMATEGPEGQCVDSLNWKDAAGSDCADYEEFMWCSARQPSCMEKGVGCHEEMLSGFEAQMKMLKRYHDLRLAMQAAQRNAKYYVNHDANMMRRDGINDTEIILQNEAEAKARYDNISREVTATFDQEDKDYVTIGGVGPGWVSEWGEFSDWMSRPFQSSASQACCACGAIKTLRAVREARNAAANVYGGQGVAPLPPKEPRQAVSVVWRYKGSSGNDGHIGELRYSIPLEHQWIHVAGTYNATTGQSVLYVNGNKVATDTSSQIGSILYARGEQPNVTFMSPLNNDTAVNSTCAKGEIQDVNIWRTFLLSFTNSFFSHTNSTIHHRYRTEPQ